MASERPIHTAEEFNLLVLDSDTDLFKWFLLCYLFGKPIRSEAAIKTWQLLVEAGYDNPWAILKAGRPQLLRILHKGGYRRYDYSTIRGLHACMTKLISEYDGSLLWMLEQSQNEAEFSKRLQKLHGVGPKVAEIFTRETEEYFARRIE